MKKTVLLITAAGMLSSVASVALADPLEDAVKARRSYFQVVKFNAGPLFGMMKDKVPYDAKRAQMLADNLKLISQMKNGAMWPKGSDKVSLPGKTRALAAIWAADSDIGDKAGAFKKAIADLADAAGKGKDELVVKVKALGGACSACHKKYRAKEF